MKFYRIITLLFILGALFITGCCVVDPINDDNDHGYQYTLTRDFDQTVQAGTQNILRVKGINGKIYIRGVSDEDQVSVKALYKVKTDSREDAERQIEKIHTEITTTNSTVKIESIHPNSSNGRTFTIDYEIEVPSDWKAQVINLNGEVILDSVRNDAEITLTNGNINLEDHSGDISCGLTNGNIQVNSELPDHGSWIMSITNGQMLVSLPRLTSATFSASITNGTISTQNLELKDSTTTRHSTQGRLNDGDGTITLSVVNGQIVVEGTN